MFIIKRETHYRLIGCIGNGFVMIAFACFACILVFLFLKGLVDHESSEYLLNEFAGIILFSAEAWLSYLTFDIEYVDSPESPMLNLPLYAVDLLLSLLAGDFVKQITNYIDFAQLILIPLVTLRYIGLAWTDKKCFLKRIVSPVRGDPIPTHCIADEEAI